MGAASEGGYLGIDSDSFFSAVVSGAAGSYIVTLMADAGFSTDLTIQPGQDVRISGDPGLSEAPIWGSGGFTVAERGMLLLTHVRLGPRTCASAGVDGRLIMRQVPLASSSLFMTISMSSYAVVTLDRVTVNDHPEWGELTAQSVTSDSSLNSLLLSTVDATRPSFAVHNGPCAVYGQCVGRPAGYMPDERCEIEAILGGTLAPCRIFDTDGGGDPIVLTWQGSASFSGLNCPAGRQLQAGEIITWSSSESWQGDDTGDQHAVENGGLPRSKTAHVMGGGWELCFEPEVRPAGRRLEATEHTMKSSRLNTDDQW
jgi:hypothetical protein